MKKILIVDDEYLVRIGIKSITNWEKHGYCIVGEATDGLDALNKIEILSPDIVFTDIKMPNLDGIELIKQASKKFKNVKFVVLSSYNDYDNVRTAMKLGAIDYIFKLRVTEKDLLNILNEIKISSSSTKSDDLRQDILISRQVKNILNLSTVIIANGQYQELLQYLKIDDVNQVFKILLMSIDNYWLYEKKDTDITKYAVYNIAAEIVYQKVKGYVINLEGAFLLAIFTQDCCEESIQECYDSVRYQVEKYINLRLSGTMLSTSLKELKCSIKSAKELISEKFWYKVECRNIITHQERNVIQSKYNLNDICCYLTDGNFDGIIKEVCNLFITIEENCNTISETRRKIMMLYSIVESKCSEFLQQKEFKDKNEVTLYEATLKYDYLFQIKDCFIEYLKCYFSELYRQKRILKKEIIDTQIYIRENLDKTITVSDIAHEVCLNASYLSHIFRKETGITITDYIIARKMEKAKELLTTTSFRINEISEMIGIYNTNYFSVVFKKKFGQSPQEYRRKIKEI